VAALLRAERRSHDVGLRIVVSGGQGQSEAVAWMRTFDLETAAVIAPVRLGTRFTVAHDDPLARHKTLNYWRRRLARDQAREAGYVDALAVSPDGRIWETTRANLFALVNGALLTPELDGPILPGVMRQTLMEVARCNGVDVFESDVPWHQADALFMTNSVRGLVVVDEFEGRRCRADLPALRALRDALHAALWFADGGEHFRAATP
jgi:branched-subunit amino acid aminotransferase/4-amino-4-deoxychorismate lyase